jgi:Domain of unknown function (DUF4041)
MIFLLCVAIAVLYYVLTKKIQDGAKSAKREQDRLLFMLQKYDGLSSKEEYQRQLDSSIHTKEAELAAKQSILDNFSEEQKKLQRQIDKLKLTLGDFEEETDLQTFGFYQPKYSFISSGDYYTRLKQVKDEQKEMHRAGEAGICQTSWVVKGSEREGRKLAKNFLKLILTIFNSECDSIIAKVKPSNVTASEEKIKKHFQDLNKLARVIECEITERYLSLRIKELQLQYEYECKRQEEKEQEQELNARLKQEARERRMLEEESKKIQEAQEKENIYQQELKEAQIKKAEIEKALLQRDDDAAQGRQKIQALQDQLQIQQLQIKQLEGNLAEATRGREEAESRSRLIKAGYIYVISNIGTLGRDVYRICMTKRNDNEDGYVRSMTPEVPFPFDIHFKFVSEDASGTLRQLHQRFDDRRVNVVNPRREFFRVSYDEIAQAIEEIQKETGALKDIRSERSPQAYEYRRTQAAESEKNTSRVQVSGIRGEFA